MFQEEYDKLKKKYQGQYLWALGYFCRTTGSVTEEMIKQYIEEQGKDNIKEIFKIDD